MSRAIVIIDWVLLVRLRVSDEPDGPPCAGLGGLIGPCWGPLVCVRGLCEASSPARGRFLLEFSGAVFLFRASARFLRRVHVCFEAACVSLGGRVSASGHQAICRLGLLAAWAQRAFCRASLFWPRGCVRFVGWVLFLRDSVARSCAGVFLKGTHVDFVRWLR